MNTRLNKTISLIVLMLITSSTLFSQELTQNIRGRVIDQDTEAPLPFANIIVVGSEPVKGTTTDMNGYFVLESIAIGEVSLKVSTLGYTEKVIPGLAVVSGKETQLTIHMEESFHQIDEVEVNAGGRSSDDVFEMSMISTSSFSVEEAQRSPGSFNDPARMVSTFAGVSSDPSGSNDIIVRGNSPKGIQWRLEGVEIPNPNHFADEGTTGGPINILNSDLMANSAFHSGAFAPQYGNAYSGIMDLEMRTGNSAKREYSFSAGVLGLEASAEGPVLNGKRASYLVNYRYSTLTLLDQLGIVDYGGVPQYQDAAFKLHVPTNKAGTFTLFGLGGYSKIQEEYEDDNGMLEEKFLFKSYMGTVALKHSYLLGENTFIKSDVSVSMNGNINDGQEIEEGTMNLYTYYRDDMQRLSYAANTALTHKFSSRHVLKAGVGIRLIDFDYELEAAEEDQTTLTTYLDEKGNSSLLNGFVSWKYRITEDLTLVSGAHYQQFMLNNEYSVEPRASLKWQFTDRQSIFGGFGLHSKLEPLTYYFSQVSDSEGNTSQANKDLGLSKAAHYVIGYENQLGPNMKFKAEAYYQSLYNVPVEDNDSSKYSVLNSFGYFTDARLVNEGTGKNYGLELTLERYFAKQYYFTFTASLYDSKYTAKDGIERNTRFNGNYSFNAIGGKEFNLGKPEKHKVIGITTRFTYAGGGYVTPILLDESIAAGEEVEDETNYLGKKMPDYYKLNLSLYYTRDTKHVTHTVKVEVENATNNQSPVYEYYNSDEEQIEEGSQMAILPVIRYTLKF